MLVWMVFFLERSVGTAWRYEEGGCRAGVERAGLGRWCVCYMGMWTVEKEDGVRMFISHDAYYRG